MSNQKLSTATPQGGKDEQPTRESESDAPGMTDSIETREEELSLDIVFEVLKNPRRRKVLEYLSKEETTVSLGELADYVTAKENDTTVDAITSTERKRVYVALYQFHLPKMDDIGLIDFNKDRGRVTLTALGRDLLDEKHQHSPALLAECVVLSTLGLFGLVGFVSSFLLGSILVALVSLLVVSVGLFLFAGYSYIKRGSSDQSPSSGAADVDIIDNIISDE